MKLIRSCLAFSLMPLVMGACSTPTGSYEVMAINASGEPVSPRTIASGRGVYTARNALCIAKPGSVITIKAIDTGEHLPDQSPYRCK